MVLLTAVLPGSKPVVHGAPGYARYFRLTAFLAGVFYRLCLLRGKYGPIFGSIRLYRRGDRFIALALFQRDYADYGRELNYLLVNRPSKKAGRQQKVKK